MATSYPEPIIEYAIPNANANAYLYSQSQSFAVMHFADLLSLKVARSIIGYMVALTIALSLAVAVK